LCCVFGGWGLGVGGLGKSPRTRVRATHAGFTLVGEGERR
jgi:hypothetical protein